MLSSFGEERWRRDMSFVVTLCTTWFNSRKFYVLPTEWKNMFCIVFRKKSSQKSNSCIVFLTGGLRTEPWNTAQINLELKGLNWRRTCACVRCANACVTYVKKLIIVYLYTLFNKNEAACYFVRSAQALTWRIVAIIIRVFYFPHICEFVAFLCLPFITINHAAYTLTKDTNTFA